jgi:hypothetical protein
VFDGGRWLGFAAEDEAAAFAAFVRCVINLLPEADEVIDGGYDGDDGHPVDGGNSDEVHSDDEAAAEVGKPEPVVPPVSENGGDDGDNLDDGFQLADLAGFDGKAFGGGNGTKAGDEKLAADDQDGDPWFNDGGCIGDKDDVGRCDHELVGEGVEQHAHGGDLAAAAGEIAVQAIGDAGQDEDERGDNLLLAAAKPGCAVSLKGEDGREDPDEQRNACDTAHRDGVGQVHRWFSWRPRGWMRGADISILP